MAKAERGSRSQAVRDYLKEHPEAGPKEVVEALKERGMTISAALVSNIKSGGQGTRRRAAAGRTRRRGKLSQAIRAYLEQNPNAGPKEIQAALASQGIKVKSGLIGSVKHHFRRGGKKVAAGRPEERRPAGGELTGEQLIQVKKLTDAVGGPDVVRTALDTLEQLR